MMIILGARLLTCKSFRKIGIFSKLVHSLDSVNIPDFYQDWDAEHGDVYQILPETIQVSHEGDGSHGDDPVDVKYVSAHPTYLHW